MEFAQTGKLVLIIQENDIMKFNHMCQCRVHVGH